MSFISYRRHLVFLLFNSVYRAHRTQRPVYAADKIWFVKYLNIFPFVLSRTITFQGSIRHVAPSVSTFPPSQVGEEKTKQASDGGFIDFGLISMSGDQFSLARFRPPTRCLGFFFNLSNIC